jgi:hypothetical protein
VGEVVQLKEKRQERDRERRKLDPRRQALVRQIAQHHPEWGPEELQKLHQGLDDWGE